MLRASIANKPEPIKADDMEEGKLYVLTRTVEGGVENVTDYSGVLAMRSGRDVYGVLTGPHGRSIFGIGSLCGEVHYAEEVVAVAVTVK